MSNHPEEIIRKYSGSMFRYAYSYCGSRADAEDIVQEAFYRYLVKKPVFRDENHEKAWFLRVTINLSQNYVRTFWHRKVDALEDDIPDVTNDEKEIWDLVHQLPDKYRVVIELHYWEGYSLNEIAVILKKNPSTVGTWFERAKRLLGKSIRSDTNG